MERELTIEQLKELDRIRRLHYAHGEGTDNSAKLCSAIKEYGRTFGEDMLRVLTEFHGDKDVAARTLVWIFSEAITG